MWTLAPTHGLPRRARRRWRRSPRAGGGNRPIAALGERKTPQRGHSHAGFLPKHPGSPRERPPSWEKAAPPLLRRPHFKWHIESDDRLLDPPPTHPFFSPP